ncbi:hypothetical protein [Pseudomonas alkylphenolica]|uniref:hypothetical protein n=1 Tax=Pseudomonas alkylphenolica TaxID=237609 RepID=UPI0018D9656F|nr:hypothetical protein [Pseudomonas alkylphenolica]MBH3428112.1 hypothetical protein [Pseudomonas alkylphenolica]
MTFAPNQTHLGRSLRGSTRRLRLAAIGMVMAGVSGCSWIAMAGKESALSATGRNGGDNFTFAGKIPAHFGLDVNPFYYPIDPQRSTCQRQNVRGEWNARSYGTTHAVPIQDTAHSFAVALPLTYTVGLCTLRLTKIDLVIHAAHGDQAWQRTSAPGHFRVTEALPEGVPGFNDQSTLSFTAECRWLFKQSEARSRFGELEKLLQCSATGTSLQYDQLPGKTVTLAIEVNPEEEPSHDETWIKFPNGWKPCAQESSGWRWCRNPPTFQTFQMNGQTCTVYPGCTE